MDAGAEALTWAKSLVKGEAEDEAKDEAEDEADDEADNEAAAGADETADNDGDSEAAAPRVAAAEDEIAALSCSRSDGFGCSAGLVLCDLSQV